MMNHGEKGQLILGISTCPRFANSRHHAVALWCSSRHLGRVMLFLGVFGILHLWLVSFEGVFHGAGGRVSHPRHYVGVGIEGETYVGVS